MKSESFLLKAVVGTKATGTTYYCETDVDGMWLYLTKLGHEELKKDVLIGIVVKNNNRGLTVSNHFLTGKRLLMFYSWGLWEKIPFSE